MRDELKRGEPWWVEAAVEFLDRYIADLPAPPQHAFEWGSGASTLWLADRVQNLVTVEHEEDWHRELGHALAEHGAGLRVQMVLVPQGSPPDTPWHFYAAAIENHDHLFGLVAIDGRARVRCAEHAIPKLAPGGILILDDSERTQYRRIWDLTSDWTRVDFHKPPQINHPEGWGTTIWFKPA